MIRSSSENATEAGLPEATVLLLLAASAAALLWPAVMAARLRQPLLASLMGSVAILWLCNDLVDRNVPGLLGSAILPWIPCALHVCSHLTVVQLSLIVLGPADPSIDCLLGSSESTATKRFTFIGMFAVCAGVLAAGWRSRDIWSPHDFDRICVLVDQILVGTGFALFWFCNARRRAMAPKIFLYAHFWKRMLFVATPVAALAVITAMHSVSPTNPVMQVVFRIAAAVVASITIWIIFDIGSLVGEESLTENFPVAQWLLFSGVAICLPTVVFTLAGDLLEHAWRWPTLSMAATSTVGGFLFTAAALPLLAANTLVVALIEYVPPVCPPENIIVPIGMNPKTLKMLHTVSCNLLRIGQCFCLAAAVVSERHKTGQTLHTGCAVMMFVSFWVAVLLSGFVP